MSTEGKFLGFLFVVVFGCSEKPEVLERRGSSDRVVSIDQSAASGPAKTGTTVSEAINGANEAQPTSETAEIASAGQDASVPEGDSDDVGDLTEEDSAVASFFPLSGHNLQLGQLLGASALSKDEILFFADTESWLYNNATNTIQPLRITDESREGGLVQISTSPHDYWQYSADLVVYGQRAAEAEPFVKSLLIRADHGLAGETRVLGVGREFIMFFMPGSDLSKILTVRAKVQERSFGVTLTQWPSKFGNPFSGGFLADGSGRWVSSPTGIHVIKSSAEDLWLTVEPLWPDKNEFESLWAVCGMIGIQGNTLSVAGDLAIATAENIFQQSEPAGPITVLDWLEF